MDHLKQWLSTLGELTSRGEWGRFRGEANEAFRKNSSPNCSWNIFKKDFAEKTGPERVHASGAGRHAFKEIGLSLIWRYHISEQIATIGESSAIQTVGSEQAPNIWEPLI